MDKTKNLIKLIPGHGYIHWDGYAVDSPLFQLWTILEKNQQTLLEEFLEKKEIASSLDCSDGSLQIISETELLIIQEPLFQETFGKREPTKEIISFHDFIKIKHEYNNLKNKKTQNILFRKDDNKISVEHLITNKQLEEKDPQEYINEEMLIVRLIDSYQYQPWTHNEEDDFLPQLWFVIDAIPDFMLEEFLEKKEIGEFFGCNDGGRIKIISETEILIAVQPITDEMKEKYGEEIESIANLEEFTQVQKEYNKLKEQKIEGILFRKKVDKLSVEGL